jgi:hypothetical protein
MNVKRYNHVKQQELVLIYQDHINANAWRVLRDKTVKWYAKTEVLFLDSFVAVHSNEGNFLDDTSLIG